MMSDFDFLNNNNFYFQYFRNGNQSFYEKVTYYESHIEDIAYLDVEKKQEILLDYMLCLFEIGRYEKFLKEVDPIIEMVIAENIYEFNGENIFNNLLRKKSACFINLKRPKEAIPLLTQLLRIDPDNISLPYYFYLSNRKISQGSEEVIKGVAIIFLMCSLYLKFAETFVVDPFFSEYLQTFNIIITSFFIIGITLLLSNEIYRRWHIKTEIKRIKKK